MINLQICDISCAPALIAGWAAHTISFIDKPPSAFDNRTVVAAFAKPHHERHLILYFHDIQGPIHGYVHPTAEHLDAVLAFAEGVKPGDNVLIHCHAGISRSTAMAIAVLMKMGMPWREAFDFVAQVRPVLWPNALIVDLTDAKFGLNGEYAQFVREWKNLDMQKRIIVQVTKEDADEMKRLKALFDRPID